MSFDLLSTLATATEVALLASVTIMPILHAWSRTKPARPVCPPVPAVAPAPAPEPTPEPTPVVVAAAVPPVQPSRLAALRAKFGQVLPPAINREHATPDDVEAALQRHAQPPAKKQSPVPAPVVAIAPDPAPAARKRGRPRKVA